jgi:hypothetical protein
MPHRREVVVAIALGPQPYSLFSHPTSNIPNRSTFACPYCGARNLDQQELVKHCVESHRSDPNRVVSTQSTISLGGRPGKPHPSHRGLPGPAEKGGRSQGSTVGEHRSH